MGADREGEDNNVLLKFLFGKYFRTIISINVSIGESGEEGWQWSKRIKTKTAECAQLLESSLPNSTFSSG